MAARTRMLQVAITVVNLVIVGLVFTSIWPFPSGNFKIDLPSASEVTWSYSDGIVSVVAPFSIDNGGFYDVRGLSITYEVTNYSRTVLASGALDVGDIPAGQRTSSQLEFDFDIIGLYEQGALWMVFNDDMLFFRIDVACRYTMELVRFYADYRVGVEWHPLIESYDVNPVWPPTGSEVAVNWWLNTSKMLRLVPPATMRVAIIGYDGPDGTGNPTLLSSVQETIRLGGHEEGTVSLTIPTAPYASYRIVYSFDVAGFGIPEESYVLPGVSP
ncbi:MAG: hypothetical protein QXJ32_02260 [Thermoplasmata archaeon]